MNVIAATKRFLEKRLSKQKLNSVVIVAQENIEQKLDWHLVTGMIRPLLSENQVFSTK